MAMKIREWMQKETEIRVLDSRDLTFWEAVRPKRSVLSNGAYEQDFGQKLRPWKEALKEYVLETIQ